MRKCVKLFVLLLAVALLLSACAQKSEPESAGAAQPTPTESKLPSVSVTKNSKSPSVSVGSYITFGHYEQDADETNGPEPIEWLVLDYDAANNRVLLISQYGLDAKPYNKEFVDITWENCTLRTWLNKDFLDAAFSEQEQSAILMTQVDNGKSQGYSGYDTNGGNNTQDKIFLLSYAEANKYLGVTHEDSNNMKSRTAPTAYAIKNGVSTSSEFKTAEGTAAGCWWLRSPGLYQTDAAGVSTNGQPYRSSADYGDVCVRPALWLNLDSGIF